MSVQSALRRSFGGLAAGYYFRNLFFATLLFFVPIMFLVWTKSSQARPGAMKAAVLITIVYGLSALLYPYSRFVYERAVGFILGENMFSVPTVIFLPTKLLTMLFCYGLAIFIAPIGLTYLFFGNARAAG